MFHVKHYDVAVIGGGHAGAEAAAAAARRGAQVVLVTLRRDGIGVMSCNPAIGGLGKGHLVREIDALDGIMARAADAAGIQFRLLNRRKGPAVQGPRAQADRKLYRAAVQSLLNRCRGLDIVEGEVVDLILQDGRVYGLELADGTRIGASAVVLTAGTFLNGMMHEGDQRRAGGRVGDRASVRLADRLASLDLVRGRLKTGTPPRLDGRTIDWDRLESQPGDEDPVMFSFLNRKTEVRQIACGITHTNEATHDIVRRNLDRSAMYGGHIDGVGPRYCPSIEDKVVRFADKTGHQVFLEPEGLDDPTVYPNGISTSLPAEVQAAYVRTIRGLEQVTILQAGYAIEYDFFDPRGLTMALEVRSLPGLFYAGQINGTTGYEEAAAQGLVAGANGGTGAEHGATGAEQVRKLHRRDDRRSGDAGRDRAIPDVHIPGRIPVGVARGQCGSEADTQGDRSRPCLRRSGADVRGERGAAEGGSGAAGIVGSQCGGVAGCGRAGQRGWRAQDGVSGAGVSGCRSVATLADGAGAAGRRPRDLCAGGARCALCAVS